HAPAVRSRGGRAGSVRLAVGLQHLAGDAAARGDLESVLPRPAPDRGRLLPIVGGAGSRGHTLAAATAARLPGMADPVPELLAQVLRIFFREVDLIADAVEPEFDRLHRFGFPIQVVDERDRYLLCHQSLASVRPRPAVHNALRGVLRMA